MKPLRNFDAMEQSRLLNLNPIEIPCGSMDLVSSASSANGTGRAEMKIQNQQDDNTLDSKPTSEYM